MGAKKIAETMSEPELIREISRVITDLTGVQLAEKQYALVQSRLTRRMRELKLSGPLEYARYYNANEGIEIGVLTSLLTTHHTFFFREFQHFEFLLKEALPKAVSAARAAGRKTIRIWSAACSRGQEVYSLSMFLKYHLPQIAPDMDFQILGTDICEESIGIAKNGVYTWEELRVVPTVYLQDNWMKGTGEIAAFVRAKQDLRKPVSFRVANLMEIDSPSFMNEPKFDFIFCRNVFIYFTHAQIKTITSAMLRMLDSSGALFVGMSESLNGLSLPVEWIGPSIYQPRDARSNVVALRPDSSPMATPQSPRASAPAVDAARKIRVLCVDDSPTVLLLLKRILTPEKGFELVGTAGDGVEAVEKVKSLKPDIMTLDIHMPKMTGVEFLEKHFREIQTPVIVVSSVPRDDASLAYRCLELGAADYIEKPTAANLEKVDEELVFKLKVTEEAWRKGAIGPGKTRSLELDSALRRSPQIVDTDGKLRVVIADFTLREVVQGLYKQFEGTQPPSLVLFENTGDLFQGWIDRSASSFRGGRHTAVKSLRDLAPGSVSFAPMEEGLALLKKEGAMYTTSCLVVGPMSRDMIKGVNHLSVSQLIIEDRAGEVPKTLINKASLVVPLTSFSYESNRFLSEPRSGSSGGRK